MRLCEIHQCGRPYYAKGLCERHYQRERNGIPKLRRAYGEKKGRHTTMLATYLDKSEAINIVKAASIMNMTQAAFMRAVIVGEAKLVLKQSQGADRRSLVLRRWNRIYGGQA